MTHRIFYSDHSYGTDRQRNVQAIVQGNKKGWYTESHGDYYLLRDGLWQAADMSGVITELLNRGMIWLSIGTRHQVLVSDTVWVEVDEPGFHAYLDSLDWILVGETIIDSDEFQEILQTAFAHADFARRNGRLPEPDEL
jgi:hypothetical protein